MSTAAETARTYGAAWNEMDRAKRLAMLAEVWSAESRYLDPNVEVTGPEALSDYIDQVHDAIPGARLVLEGEIEEHHGHLRFHWAIIGANDQRLMSGVDFAVLAADSRLARIVGFINSTD